MQMSRAYQTPLLKIDQSLCKSRPTTSEPPLLGWKAFSNKLLRTLVRVI